jgi:hypothetical protein
MSDFTERKQATLFVKLQNMHDVTDVVIVAPLSPRGDSIATAVSKALEWCGWPEGTMVEWYTVWAEHRNAAYNGQREKGCAYGFITV